MFGLNLEQRHIEVGARIELPYKRKFSLSEGYNFIFFGLSLKEQRIVQSKDRSEPQSLKIFSAIWFVKVQMFEKMESPENIQLYTLCFLVEL